MRASHIIESAVDTKIFRRDLLEEVKEILDERFFYLEGTRDR
jgi:hypothetical protein